MFRIKCQKIGGDYRQAKSDLILIKKQLENISNNIQFDKKNKASSSVRYYKSGNHNEKWLKR